MSEGLAGWPRSETQAGTPQGECEALAVCIQQAFAERGRCRKTEMFIRSDMHRKELGDHFWDAADDFSGWEWLLFMKGA